jgi:hypothetical protein
MSPRASALRVVSNQAKEVYGDASLTDQAVQSWSAGQRRCRARKRHNWGPHFVREHRTYYEVIERCTHCSNRRTADFAKTGRKISKWSPAYRDGYLLPKGAAPIDEDLHDVLVLSDILSRRIVEVLDDEDDL